MASNAITTYLTGQGKAKPSAGPTLGGILPPPSPAPTGQANPLAQYLTPTAQSTVTNTNPLIDVLTPSARPAGEVAGVNQQIMGDINAAAAKMQGAPPVGALAGGGGYNPASAYSAALAAAAQAYGGGQQGILTQGAQAQNDIATLYRNLGLSQKQNQSEVIKGAHAGASALDNIYGALSGNIGNAYNSGRSSVDAELSRLGIQEAAPGSLQGLVRDQQFAGNMANADHTNAIANNSARENLMLDLLQSQRGASAAGGAAAQAQEKAATQAALASLATEYMKQKLGILTSQAHDQNALNLANTRAANAAKNKTPKTPTGLADAIASLGGSSQSQQMQNELRSLITSYDPSGKNSYYKGLAQDEPTLSNSLSPAQIQQILQALAIYSGRG